MGPTSDDFAVAGIAFIRRPNIPEVGGGELIMAHLYPRLRFLNGRWRRSKREHVNARCRSVHKHITAMTKMSHAVSTATTSSIRPPFA